jgi:small GTP-binding protein
MGLPAAANDRTEMQMKSKQRIARPTSSRLRVKIDRTYLYFTKEVDPLISPCVAYFLFNQPQDIIVAMRMYFDHVKKGLELDKLHDISFYNPKLSQKIYFATILGPVIAKLVDTIASVHPLDVMNFICEQLINVDFIASIFARNNQNLDEETGNVATKTRNKLNEAISLASTMGVPVIDANTLLQSGKITKILPESESELVPKEKVSEKVRNIQISFLGSSGSGKSSIINALQGNFNMKIKPSLGFKPTTMMLGENINVKFYDLGGGVKIRGIWAEYYHDVHAIIYVFDASIKEEKELNESVDLFKKTIHHPLLLNKPLLILANKQDKVDTLSSSKISELLKLKELGNQNIAVVDCASFVSKSNSIVFTTPDMEKPEVPEEHGPDDFISDPKFDTALEKFLDVIQEDFEALNKRVDIDIENKKSDEIKKRLERERKVLKNKIAIAFRNDIDASLLPENLPSPGPDDEFTKEEGIAFIAGEIGSEIDTLDEAAIEVIRLVGYQRLAMQIIGALKSPISKKKIPMSWLEIKTLIDELRNELGLK